MINKNTLRYVIILILGISCIAGCTTSLSYQGEKVRIIEGNEGYQTKFLGTVSGFDTLGISTGAESENALNEVRNKAAALGANAIKIIHMQTTIQGTSVTAEALLVDFPVEQ